MINIQATNHLKNKHCEMLSLMHSERMTRTSRIMGKGEVMNKTTAPCEASLVENVISTDKSDDPIEHSMLCTLNSRPIDTKPIEYYLWLDGIAPLTHAILGVVVIEAGEAALYPLTHRKGHEVASCCRGISSRVNSLLIVRFSEAQASDFSDAIAHPHYVQPCRCGWRKH